MIAQDYWQMFLETGAPEIYLMYNNAKKMENSHVLENESSGTAGNTLQ